MSKDHTLTFTRPDGTVRHVPVDPDDHESVMVAYVESLEFMLGHAVDLAQLRAVEADLRARLGAIQKLVARMETTGTWRPTN